MIKSAYIASIIISFVSGVLYLLRYNRIAKKYKLINKNFNPVKVTIYDVIVVVIECFIPCWNLYVGFNDFKYSFLANKEEFLRDIFKVNI